MKLSIRIKLNKNRIPNWNFGPNSSNYKNVFNVTKKIISTWGLKKNIIKIKKANFKESTILRLNNQKARKELGWYPKLNFEETIKLTVDWYKVLERNGNFEKITKDQIEFFMKKKS